MFEWSDQLFETIVIYILKALIEKVSNMQGQTDNISREMEILRKIFFFNARDQKHLKRNEVCLWWAN